MNEKLAKRLTDAAVIVVAAAVGAAGSVLGGYIAIRGNERTTAEQAKREAYVRYMTEFDAYRDALINLEQQLKDGGNADAAEVKVAKLDVKILIASDEVALIASDTVAEDAEKARDDIQSWKPTQTAKEIEAVVTKADDDFNAFVDAAKAELSHLPR
jgi:hypothetical protein